MMRSSLYASFIVVYILLLAFVYALAVRSKICAWLLFLFPIIALAVEPIELWTVFSAAKIVALAIGALCVNLARLRLKGNHLFVMAVIICPLVLAINILEAVSSDAFSGYDDVGLGPFYLNALGGLALAVAVALFARSGRVCESKYLAFESLTKSGSVSHFLLDAPRVWVIGYTIWNIVFTYGYASNVCDTEVSKHGYFTLRTICVLVVPLASEFALRGSWLEARCYTLVFDFSAVEVFCAYKAIDRVYPLVIWYTGTAHWVIAAMCAAVSVAALSFSAWTFVKQRGLPLPLDFLVWSKTPQVEVPNPPEGGSVQPEAVPLASPSWSTPSPSHSSSEEHRKDVVFAV